MVDVYIRVRAGSQGVRDLYYPGMTLQEADHALARDHRYQSDRVRSHLRLRLGSAGDALAAHCKTVQDADRVVERHLYYREAGSRRRSGWASWLWPRSPAIKADGCCVVCLCAPSDTILSHGDSGHRVCCWDCALQLVCRDMACPVCRAPVDGVVLSTTQAITGTCLCARSDTLFAERRSQVPASGPVTPF